MDPRRTMNLEDPGVPDEITPRDEPTPEELPVDNGAPLNDWEIPDGTPDVIL